jgi:nucleoside phosphorylase
MIAPVLVCFAVPQEARPFQKLVRNRRDVRVLITGMGTQRTARSLSATLDMEVPSRVFTCGFAGALNSALRVGDVVFDRAAVWPILQTTLESLGAKPVTFVCAAKVAITAADKNALRAASGADAVEMESRIIHDICAEHRIECVTLRAISDSAVEDLPLDFNALMTPDQTLSAVRLAWAILKSPQKIPALIRLGRNSALAAEQLAKVLARVI